MINKIKKQAIDSAILMPVKNELDEFRRELEIENAIGIDSWDQTQLLIAATNLDIFEDVDVSKFE